MNKAAAYRKIKKALALAGDNPTTPEQLSAYQYARKLMDKIEGQEKQERGGFLGGASGLALPGPPVRFPWLQKVKTIPWADFFKFEQPAYTTYIIKPDTAARNQRTEDITRAVADLFKLPIDRFTREGPRIRYHLQEKAAFEIAVENGKIAFYITLPDHAALILTRRIHSVWPGATVEKVPGYKTALDPDKTAAYEMIYKKHDLYSLETDSRHNGPLESILEAAGAIGENDKARVFTYFDPTHAPTWQNDLKMAWEKLRKGYSPQKMDFSIRDAVYYAALGVTVVMRELVTAISDIMSNDEKGKTKNIYMESAPDPRASREVVDQLTHSTKTKVNKPGLKTCIWVAVESADIKRADTMARTLAAAYGDLTADNELIPRKMKKTHKREALRVMSDKQGPKVNIKYNVLSSAEAAKLVQVPGRELQEKHPNILALDAREVPLNNDLLKGGLYIGDVTRRGKTSKLYHPIKDHDLLCLPHIVIGGMGQGKTRGYGANFIIEAVNNGMGGIVIDPAKGEAGDEIEAVLSPEKVERYKIGDIPISLDWREVKHSTRARNRLANTIISFFDSATDEAGAQTARFIRAAVVGMKTGFLSEIMDILEDDDYRKEVIETMPEGMNRATLEQFSRESQAMKNRILSPIYNRLDLILGDEFLTECMTTDNGLDFVELTSKKKAIIIDIPKGTLGPEAVDLIVNLISSKLDLAMTLRPEYMGEPDPHPFFILFDEPHQFIRSGQLWKRAAVESRKWRFSYIWMFHEWAQLDKELRDILKAALCHYHIYPSSKNTFQGLKEEIAPFTVEDGLKLKRWHAINVIRAGDDGTATPTIAKMALPPSKRKGRESE